jgi:hypothetical protein
LIYEYGSAIQSIKSNNFIYTVVNTEDPLTNSFTGVKVIKTDSSNNLIWNKPISDLTQATSLILLANGDILMLGNRGSDLTGTNNTMVIVKLNSDGNTIFRKDYTGQFFYSSTEILEEPANYTLVAYKVVNQPHYFQTLHPSLIKIDFSGNIISATQLDSLMAGSAHYYNSFHLKKNKPGGYLLTTTYTDIIDPTVGGVTNEYFNLKILNPDGSIAKSVDLTAAGNHKAVFQISDAIQTLNGNVYVLVCLQGW